MPTGATIAVDVKNLQHDRIADIQDHIYTSQGIQPVHQLLTFGGRRLHPDHQLTRYNIDAFSTLHLSIPRWSLLALSKSEGLKLTVHLPVKWDSEQKMKESLKTSSPKHMNIPNETIEMPFNLNQSLSEIHSEIAPDYDTALKKAIGAGNGLKYAVKHDGKKQYPKFSHFVHRGKRYEIAANVKLGDIERIEREPYLHVSRHCPFMKTQCPLYVKQCHR